MTSDRQTPDLRELGQRLKHLRQLRGLSLEEAGRTLDLSASFISLVERGRSDLSLGRFNRICAYYGIHPSELLLQHEPAPPPDLTQVEDAATIDRGPGVGYRLIRSEPPQIIHVEFSPHSEYADVSAHHGEDVLIVVAGALELLYGDARHSVAAGTTARYQGVEPHSLANPHDAPATALIVTTERYWRSPGDAGPS